jgi:hypothetical protein
MRCSFSALSFAKLLIRTEFLIDKNELGVGSEVDLVARAHRHPQAATKSLRHTAGVLRQSPSARRLRG